MDFFIILDLNSVIVYQAEFKKICHNKLRVRRALLGGVSACRRC